MFTPRKYFPYDPALRFVAQISRCLMAVAPSGSFERPGGLFSTIYQKDPWALTGQPLTDERSQRRKGLSELKAGLDTGGKGLHHRGQIAGQRALASALGKRG